MQIEPWELAIVKQILNEQIPNLPVWAFGSRVKGTAKHYSDLDLAVVTEQPLTFLQQANLQQAFSDSDLPWKVDILDWASTSEAFKKIVLAQYVVIQ